jgi:hypothetical protein
MNWHPATKQEVEAIIAKDILELSTEELSFFEQCRVDLYQAPIIRYGNKEMVYVVARNGHYVLYWEDVEEGFNISPLDSSGRMTEHWCNQDSLKWALAQWLEK